MIVEVHSGKSINIDTLQKIKDILNHAKCPNESLRNSIPEFTSYDSKRIVQLSEGDNFVEYINI